ncbi:hypothetical protein OG579_04615 [Williamsia herbipolensis]|uniref:PE family protein n=1 Tax=Williamsia herbipolensis TaxID=1603258 RepID=A0AAU4K4V5_9NOCA|nr:hypothetical protein [Williamsia herbipolensis]
MTDSPETIAAETIAADTIAADATAAHARSVITVSGLAPTPEDRVRLEATLPQFRAMADLLHACEAARYAVPALTMNPLR